MANKLNPFEVCCGAPARVGPDGVAPPHTSPTRATPQPDQPTVYEIRIKGHLGRQWTNWFGSIAIRLEDNGDTLLTGAVVDQAALHGLLRKVRDLGMPLISVISVEPRNQPNDVPGPSNRDGGFNSATKENER